MNCGRCKVQLFATGTSVRLEELDLSLSSARPELLSEKVDGFTLKKVETARERRKTTKMWKTSIGKLEVRISLQPLRFSRS